jgi:hypothetical protein
MNQLTKRETEKENSGERSPEKMKQITGTRALTRPSVTKQEQRKKTKDYRPQSYSNSLCHVFICM